MLSLSFICKCNGTNGTPYTPDIWLESKMFHNMRFRYHTSSLISASIIKSLVYSPFVYTLLHAI